ncbi:hypothetical protein PVAND_015535 [Polypedilum vanderplanki]|uniref:BTB domain-containing protein n=1 Tax=Polypedilum vanderplanki TaxID=319348 RepID=A0A9J6BCI6_POLVA|nr:hypothetical protein PVAND_015535 [Polypedilum vanderplanki]
MALIECNFIKTQNIYSATVSKNKLLEVVYFYGNHKNNKNNFDVTWLYFHSSEFIKMPRNIHESFPNLNELTISSCKLNSIERENLSNLPNLAKIIIYDCGLKKLNGDLFRDLKKLEYISFFNNKLEEIDPTILSELPKLWYVDFRKNSNIDMLFDSKIPNGKTLQDLNREIFHKCQPKPRIDLSVQSGPSEQQKLQQNNAFEIENQKLKSEINKLKTELNYSNDTIEDLDHLANKHRREITILLAKQSRLDKELRDANQIANEIKNLKAQNKNLDNLVNNQRKQLTSLLAKQSRQDKVIKDTNRIANENESLKAEIKKLKNENINLKSEIQKINNENSKQAAVSQKPQSENSTSHTSHIMTENTILRKERQNLKSENERLQSSLRNQEILIKNQRENLKTLQEKRKIDPSVNEIKRILNDPAFKDFTINVGESSFKVHKILFAARSATLNEIFKNNPEAEELNLRDIPESTFKVIYDFIYNNRLSDNANYIEVITAAIRLKINDLIEIAPSTLLNKIDEKNACDVLVLSNKINNEKLRQKAFEIIQIKIFPERKLADELAKQPEKLKALIDVKKKFDEEFENLAVKGERN